MFFFSEGLWVGWDVKHGIQKGIFFSFFLMVYILRGEGRSCWELIIKERKGKDLRPGKRTALRDKEMERKGKETMGPLRLGKMNCAEAQIAKDPLMKSHLHYIYLTTTYLQKLYQLSQP